MRVDLRAGNEWPAYYLGRYDDECVDLCLRALDPGGIFVDVGANIGFYSVRIARRLPAGCRVESFEPMPANVDRLAQNLELNGVAGRVTVHPFGLSDKAGEIELKLRGPALSGAPTGNAAIAIGDDEDADLPGIRIALRSLDEIAADSGLGRIDCIKIDIEGHEDSFFRGARRTIARWRPVMLSEWCRAYHRRRRIAAESVYLADMPDDYRVFRISEGGTLVGIDTLAEAGELENLLLCPAEKIGRFGL